MQEYEFDFDTQNPHEIRLIIKSSIPFDAEALFDALLMFVHDILEPEIKKIRGPDELGH